MRLPGESAVRSEIAAPPPRRTLNTALSQGSEPAQGPSGSVLSRAVWPTGAIQVRVHWARSATAGSVLAIFSHCHSVGSCLPDQVQNRSAASQPRFVTAPSAADGEGGQKPASAQAWYSTAPTGPRSA